MSESDVWRQQIPAVGESNRWFHWVSCIDIPIGGLHVPTEHGCDLIASMLLPFSGMVGDVAGFFGRHPEARQLGRPSANAFQAVNLLVAIWPIGLTRSSLNRIFSEWLPRKDSRFRASRDPIQLVNKVSQRGIQDDRVEGVVPSEGKTVVYRIPVPIRFTALHLAVRTGAAPADAEEQIERTKRWLKTHFIDVPPSKWQIGHRNPALSDADPANVVMQPPAYNGPLRDRFIFDERGLIRCPTPTEFSARLRDYIVSEEGARVVFEALLREYPQLADRSAEVQPPT
jgi:hypothetical protein